MKRLFYVSDSRICDWVYQISGEYGGVKKENQISYPFANKGAKDRQPEETYRHHRSKNSYIYVIVQTQNMFHLFIYFYLNLC